MRTFLFLLLALTCPFYAFPQFTIGQTSGNDLIYHDFPDTTICSFGLEEMELDLDGDQTSELKMSWGLGTPYLDCLPRELHAKVLGGAVHAYLPELAAQGNVIDAQQPFQSGLQFTWIDYCPDHADSTSIHWIDLDFFGPGAESYMLLQLDSMGTQFAWLRASTDTSSAGNYCITFKDAAVYKPFVSVPDQYGHLKFRVFPSLFQESLWLQGAFEKPTPLELRYLSMDGRLLAAESLLAPRGVSPVALPLPPEALGLFLLEIRANGRREVVKLVRVK